MRTSDTGTATFSNAGSAAAVGAPSGGNSTGGGTQQQPNQTFDPTDPSAIPDYGGIYGAAQTAADTAYENAKTSLAAKRQGIMSQYGYSADGSVDGNNQLGLYQQNRRADAMDLGGAENEAFDRGLGLRGLGAQVAEAPLNDIGVRDANLGGQYADALHGNDLDLQGALSNHTQALLDARQAEIQNAIASGWFNAPGTDDGTGSDGSGASSNDQSPPPPNSRAARAAARITRIPQQVSRAQATRTVNRAVSRGEPVSEHGMGGGYTSPPKRDTRPTKSTYKGRH